MQLFSQLTDYDKYLEENPFHLKLGIDLDDYAQLDKNQNLIEYKPIKYIALPLREYSALITRIERKIMRIKFFSLYKDKTKITQKIILKMKEISEKNGSKFAFVNLYPSSESTRISGKNHLISYNKFCNSIKPD